MCPFEYLVTRFWCACKKCTEHTNILVVVGKCVCNSRKLDLSCGLTCVYQHRLPAALGAIFLPPCLYNTNTEATQKFKFIISKAYSGSLFMDLFRPIFHAVLHCIPVSCQLGKWMGCKPCNPPPHPPLRGAHFAFSSCLLFSPFYNLLFVHLIALPCYIWSACSHVGLFTTDWAKKPCMAQI